tara:strand:+ start:44 stop:403 length:360 start_codon:yes stop_codon:yes gene_type:complete
MEITKILEIFKEHGFDENNCSFFGKEDINDIAKDVIASINNTNFCKGLRGKSKSFFNLKTIDDIKILYPNQESYGVSVSKGLLRFYVNDNLIHTKAVNYIEECTEVTPEMYKHIKTRKK